MAAKIILVGAGGTGKTTFVHSLKCGQFDPVYTPTIGFHVIPVTFFDTIFNIWDCAGQEQFGVLKEHYWVGAKAALVFHNGDDETIQIADRYIADINRLHPNIPILVCCAKKDLLPQNHQTTDISLSCKMRDNVNEPLLKLYEILQE
jgi:GTP-binding nuclear protein Ran